MVLVLFTLCVALWLLAMGLLPGGVCVLRVCVCVGGGGGGGGGRGTQTFVSYIGLAPASRV